MTPETSGAYPAELIFRPSRLRFAGLLFVALLFLGGSVLMVAHPKADTPPHLGVLSIGFSLLMCVVFIVNLLPNASYLKLTADGFEMRSLFRSTFMRWDRVIEFAPGRVGMNAMVFMVLHGDGKANLSRKMSAALTGGAHGSLPDTYGMSAADLAKLLNEWRRRGTGAG